jgi:tetratricopeptide (TPR) repeat protein
LTAADPKAPIGKELDVIVARELAAAGQSSDSWRRLLGYSRTYAVSQELVKAKKLARVIIEQADDPGAKSSAWRFLSSIARMEKNAAEEQRCLEAAVDVLFEAIRSKHDNAGVVSELVSRTEELAAHYVRQNRAQSAIDLRKRLLSVLPPDKVPNFQNPLTLKQIANSRIALARELMRTGKSSEAVGEIETAIAHFPEYCNAPGLAAAVRLDWINAHEYPEKSLERTKLLEKVYYQDPIMQTNLIIGKIGLDLAWGYRANKDPRLEDHLRDLTTRLERYRDGPKEKWAVEHLDYSFELALTEYGDALLEKKKFADARAIYEKELKLFPNRPGGEHAKRFLGHLKAYERRGSVAWIRLAIVAFAVGLATFLIILARRKRRTVSPLTHS